MTVLAWKDEDGEEAPCDEAKEKGLDFGKCSKGILYVKEEKKEEGKYCSGCAESKAREEAEEK